jgi:hypothetical protein
MPSTKANLGTARIVTEFQRIHVRVVARVVFEHCRELDFGPRRVCHGSLNVIIGPFDLHPQVTTIFILYGIYSIGMTNRRTRRLFSLWENRMARGLAKIETRIRRDTELAGGCSQNSELRISLRRRKRLQPQAVLGSAERSRLGRRADTARSNSLGSTRGHREQWGLWASEWREIEGPPIEGRNRFGPPARCRSSARSGYLRGNTPKFASNSFVAPVEGGFSRTDPLVY